MDHDATQQIQYVHSGVTVPSSSFYNEDSFVDSCVFLMGFFSFFFFKQELQQS